jgi:hypothetical protein
MLPEEMADDAIWALTVAVIYFGSFIVLAFIAKKVCAWLMRRHGVDLRDIQEQAGQNRSARHVFLLGIWRKEG